MVWYCKESLSRRLAVVTTNEEFAIALHPAVRTSIYTSKDMLSSFTNDKLQKDSPFHGIAIDRFCSFEP